MITVDLDSNLLKKLDELVVSTQKSRSTLIQNALKSYLFSKKFFYREEQERFGVCESFYQLLLDECKSPKHLTTLKRKKPFVIYTDEEKLWVENSACNIESGSKPRVLTQKEVDLFWEMYTLPGGFKPYRMKFFNSSYLLAAYVDLKYNGII